MKPSTYLNGLLTVIAVLLALNLWVGLHAGSSPANNASLSLATPAHAQGRANPAEERQEMIGKLDEINESVQDLSDKLDNTITRNGLVRVQVESMPDGD